MTKDRRRWQEAPRSYQVPYHCQTPKKWFLTRSLILDLLQASEILVSSILRLWPRSQPLPGALDGGIFPDTRFAVYGVNKWEVNTWWLMGARNISLEWSWKLGLSHMLHLYYSQKELRQELWNWWKILRETSVTRVWKNDLILSLFSKYGTAAWQALSAQYRKDCTCPGTTTWHLQNKQSKILVSTLKILPVTSIQSIVLFPFFLNVYANVILWWWLTLFFFL